MVCTLSGRATQKALLARPNFTFYNDLQTPHFHFWNAYFWQSDNTICSFGNWLQLTVNLLSWPTRILLNACFQIYMLPLKKRSIELVGIVFKTYNKDKPAKYGLSFRSLGSSTRSFIYLSVSYAGKINTVTKTYITKVNLVMKIADGYEAFGHSLNGANITMDRYYT